MQVLKPFAAALFAVFVMAGAARAADDVHPYDTLKKLGAVHLIAQDIDASSFKKAIAYYPYNFNRKFQTIDMGPYMMWKIINLFPTKARVSRMWLHRFSQRCVATAKYAGHPIGIACTIVVDLRVTVGRRGYRMTYVRRGVNVGAYFNPDDKNYVAARRAEMRKPVDDAIAAMAIQMRKHGFLAAE